MGWKKIKIAICDDEPSVCNQLFDWNTSRSKGNARGIGLSHVKSVAEKYSGAMLTEKAGSSFRLSVLLNMGDQNLYEER